MVTYSNNTTLLGIFGNPISHSLSPVIHNAALRACGLDYVYLPFCIKEEDLLSAVEGLRSFNMRGVNVTIPYKEKVILYLDKLSERAQKTGSVNTIINDSGVLVGDTTDGAGFLSSFKQAFGEVAGSTVLVLGAGGAAKAICFALAEEGCKLIITNRTRERAYNLSELINNFYSDISLDISYNNIGDIVSEIDFVVNTTSVGMTDKEETPFPLKFMRQNIGIYDIIYNPARTKMIQEAEEVGIKAVNGLGMLINQAALSFEMWTGVCAPIDIMYEAIDSLSYEL